MSHESNSASNQQNSDPSRSAYMFMEKEYGKCCRDDVSDASRRKHKCKIGPRKRGEISREESDEEENADRDQRIEHRNDSAIKIVQRNRWTLIHSHLEEEVANRSADSDSQQDEISARIHLFIKKQRATRAALFGFAKSA
ncbi:MAG: hypothetical protein JWN45_1542 [Acidobacteriaceae bacterium]|nr:hypothetical protein [Acidobacteriaceae bacterium]